MGVETHTVFVMPGGVAEERSSPMENPSIPLSDAGTFYDKFGHWGGAKTAFGIRVSHEGALRYAQFDRGVTLLRAPSWAFHCQESRVNSLCPLFNLFASLLQLLLQRSGRPSR